MESDQSKTGSLATDWFFEMEDFSPPLSRQVKGAFMEPSKP